MTTTTITLSDEDACILGGLLSRALSENGALETGDEPGVWAILSDLQSPDLSNGSQLSLLDPTPGTLFALEPSPRDTA